MDSEELNKLLKATRDQRFRKVSERRIESYNKIAQAHGGDITIESEEGVGSKFIVTMKRTRPETSEKSEVKEILNQVPDDEAQIQKDFGIANTDNIGNNMYNPIGCPKSSLW